PIASACSIPSRLAGRSSRSTGALVESHAFAARTSPGAATQRQPPLSGEGSCAEATGSDHVLPQRGEAVEAHRPIGAGVGAGRLSTEDERLIRGDRPEVYCYYPDSAAVLSRSSCSA